MKLPGSVKIQSFVVVVRPVNMEYFPTAKFSCSCAELGGGLGLARIGVLLK